MDKTFRALSKGVIVLALILSLTSPIVFAQNGVTTTPTPKDEYFAVETVILDDGRSMDATWINGPPTPPAGFERPTIEPPRPNAVEGVVTLSVPTYIWSFGCSATSAAMIAAYYDRTTHPSMYTGPTNGGVMPLDNNPWGTVSWNGETRWQCPLSATRDGLDGQTDRGHVDDYYENYGNGGPDPYELNGWTEHTPGNCTGDYMKTNKWFAIQGFNVDGGTVFYNYTNGAPLNAAALESYGVHIYDGGYGLKLFYESRGYTVASMYNQYILGYQGNTQGFTYSQYKAEIDADRPVLVHVQGHSMVGVGYDDTVSNQLYVHDTWDFATHTMEWGGSYAGMDHYAVTIVQVNHPPTAVELVSFEAEAHGKAIVVRWETASEIDNLGFNLYRGESPDGPWTQLNDNLIPSQVPPGSPIGAMYEFRDLRVSSGTTYHYLLEDVNVYGAGSFHGPVEATLGPPRNRLSPTP
jgi:hypothetical protein